MTNKEYVWRNFHDNTKDVITEIDFAFCGVLWTEMS